MPDLRLTHPDPLQPARDRVLTTSDRLWNALDALDELEGGRRSGWNPMTRRRLVDSLLATREAIDATLSRLEPGSVARPSRNAAPLKARLRC